MIVAVATFPIVFAPETETHAELPAIDVVVVSYNSSTELERCVAGFRAMPNVRIIIIDNHCDGTPDLIARLPVRGILLETNQGFAHGCNVGWRSGDAPYVVFVNPDAVVDPPSLLRLVEVLAGEPGVGAWPRIIKTGGELAFSSDDSRPMVQPRPSALSPQAPGRPSVGGRPYP